MQSFLEAGCLRKMFAQFFSRGRTKIRPWVTDESVNFRGKGAATSDRESPKATKPLKRQGRRCNQNQSRIIGVESVGFVGGGL